jgi:large subunit ribosomal protein L4
MPTIAVFNQNKEEVSSIDLPDDIFNVEVRESLFYSIVRYQTARSQAGTHATKNRSMIAGGGKKPYRQKGTGRARQGTVTAPHYRGGGVVHGPHHRSHAHKMNKKARRAALIAALSRRCQEKALTVLDKVELSEIKTKHFKAIMQNFSFDELLLVTAGKDETVSRSARNLPNVKVLPVEGLNVYDILNHSNLVLTCDAVALVNQRLGK